MDQFFVDSHAHLDDAGFDADRDAVIERARAAGVRYLLSVSGGTGPENLALPIGIAERHDWIYATVGVHPHEAGHFQDSHAEQILKCAAHPKVVAIGEIGLDYYYDHSPRDIQKRVLIRQMELAREAKLPIIIHCRDAWTDLAAIAQKHWQASGIPGILHCFTGSREDAFKFLDWGFLVSFAGNVTFRKAEGLREVAREIPLDRLLTETDCPYLAPAPHRGKRNEPALVREVARQLAELRGLTLGEIGGQALRNFEQFFHLGSP
jgi:TatD DNase family protein